MGHFNFAYKMIGRLICIFCAYKAFCDFLVAELRLSVTVTKKKNPRGRY